MKNLFIVLVGTSVLFSACKKHFINPSSDITSMERFVEEFIGVDVSEAIEVTITYSNNEQKVVVEANSNLHPYVMTEVVGGKLKIHMQKNVKLGKNSTIKVHVTMPEIVLLEVSGASEVTFTNQIVTNHLDIEASGASKISGSLNAASVNLELSGASEVNFQGASSLATFSMSGASTFDSFSFHVNDLNADLSGASVVFVTVNNHLNLVASGASEFHYSGDCSIGELSLTGSSTLHKH